MITPTLDPSPRQLGGGGGKGGGSLKGGWTSVRFAVHVYILLAVYKYIYILFILYSDKSYPNTVLSWSIYLYMQFCLTKLYQSMCLTKMHIIYVEFLDNTACIGQGSPPISL